MSPSNPPSARAGRAQEKEKKKGRRKRRRAESKTELGEQNRCGSQKLAYSVIANWSRAGDDQK
jgi:hypothetical protein